MPIEEVVDTIINDVEAYTADEEQDDDITLVAVRVIKLAICLNNLVEFNANI